MNHRWWLLAVLIGWSFAFVASGKADEERANPSPSCGSCLGKGIEIVTCGFCDGDGEVGCFDCIARFGWHLAADSKEGSFGVVNCRGCTGPLLAVRPSSRCSICKGKGFVRCEGCLGKAARDCPACRGEKTVSIPCRVCLGVGSARFAPLLASQGVFDCARCSGAAIAPCSQCILHGKPKPCLPCAGTGRRVCNQCGGVGKHLCRDCFGRDGADCRACDRKTALVPCGGCKGKKAEKCRGCSGSGKSAEECLSCHDTGVAPCAQHDRDSIHVDLALATALEQAGNVSTTRAVLERLHRNAGLFGQDHYLLRSIFTGSLASISSGAGLSHIARTVEQQGVELAAERVATLAGIRERLRRVGGIFAPTALPEASDVCFTCRGVATPPSPCTSCIPRTRLFCRVCVGTGRVERRCPECLGVGKTPPRSSAAEIENCPWCFGATLRACLSCTDGSRSHVDCDRCERTGHELCAKCKSTKREDCPSCEREASERGEYCPMCKGAGFLACSACGIASLGPCDVCQGVGQIELVCFDCGGTTSRLCDCATSLAHRPWQSTGDRFLAAGDVDAARRGYEIAKSKLIGVAISRELQLAEFAGAIKAAGRVSEKFAPLVERMTTTLSKVRAERASARASSLAELGAKLAALPPADR